MYKTHRTEGSVVPRGVALPGHRNKSAEMFPKPRRASQDTCWKRCRAKNPPKKRTKKMCGAYPFVGYCGSFLNKLPLPKISISGSHPALGRGGRGGKRVGGFACTKRAPAGAGNVRAFEGSTRGVRPTTSALPPHSRAIAHNQHRPAPGRRRPVTASPKRHQALDPRAAGRERA